MLASEGCVSALLEHGASVLYRDSQGRTPLHFAACQGQTELLRFLLKAALKADPLDSMLDYSGYTPTHWAAHHGEKPGCLTDMRLTNTTTVTVVYRSVKKSFFQTWKVVKEKLTFKANHYQTKRWVWFLFEGFAQKFTYPSSIFCFLGLLFRGIWIITQKLFSTHAGWMNKASYW